MATNRPAPRLSSGRPSTSRRPRTGISLLVLAVISALTLGYLALAAVWTPKLGLDLRGGTSVTLIPRSGVVGQQVSDTSVDQAVEIIRQRVNGLGVAEAEVAKNGSGASSTIVVSIPGVNENRVVDLVGSTAQLNFRPVANAAAGVPVTPVIPSVSPSPSGNLSPSGSTTPSASTTVRPSSPTSSTAKPSSSTTKSNGGHLSAALRAATSPSPSSTANPSPSSSVSVPPPGRTMPIAERQDTTNSARLQAIFAELDCTNAANRQGGSPDVPTQWLVTCDRSGSGKYLLQPAEVLGTDVSGATATVRTTGLADWIVNLTFTSDGTRKFAATTQRLVSQPAPANQFAITLDGVVISAPVVQSVIANGQAEITGRFTQQDAQDLSNVLKYGALPLTFDRGEVSAISPTLGSDQLNAGLIAGGLGLILVVAYCLLYYRGIGAVAVASLFIAGTLDYLAVVALGHAIGFTLTLAGVTGLIVAIGVTADSFVVLFERIRDEIRDGRSPRVAIDAGWIRARRTILAADTVSLIAAVILYLASVGSVRGFAFTLGLTTLIDVLVVFTFTKPTLTLLSRTKFFGEGHRLSGLSPAAIATRRPTPVVRESGLAERAAGRPVSTSGRTTEEV